MHTKLLLAGAAAALASLAFAPTAFANTSPTTNVVRAEGPIARATTPPPTVPCTGCGPSGQTGNGTAVWAYTEHRCLPNGDSQFGLVYGVGSAISAPKGVQFYVYHPPQQISIPLDKPVKPGRSADDINVAIVPHGHPAVIWVGAVDVATGRWLHFYETDANGNQLITKTFKLVCECVQPTTTTVATTTPSSTVTTVATSTPGTSPVTTPAVASTSFVPAKPGDTLPATGFPIRAVAFFGLIFMTFGLVAIGMVWYPGKDRS